MPRRDSVEGSSSLCAATPQDDNKQDEGSPDVATTQEMPVKPEAAMGSQERPHSVFTAKEKWFLVALSGMAAMYRFVICCGSLEY